MSFRTEACQIRGKDSQSSLCWKRNLPGDICGPGRDWQKIKQLTDLRTCGQKFGRKLVKPLRIEKIRMGKREARTRQCSKVERHFFINPEDGESQENHQRCEQYTHKYSTYRVAQSDHFSSRERAWLKIASLGVPKTFCHPRVMSHSMPHLTLTRSTISLSLTSPFFPRSLQHAQDLWYTMNIYPAMFHCRVADQHKSHLLQVMSPNRLSSKTSRPKRSILKTSIPEELRLEGILGQIRIKSKKDLWETSSSNFGWIWKSWWRHLLPPVKDAFRLRLSGEHCRLGSWRWRTAKNAGFTTVCAESIGL